MKSTERLLAAIIALIAIGGAVQAALLLPYRVEQVEKAQITAAALLEAEKKRAEMDRETLIRIEEQLKGLRATVEDNFRRQRFSNTRTETGN